MQYFLGYRSFSVEPHFDPSLFVEFRKKLGVDQINDINEKIISMMAHLETPKSDDSNDDEGSKGRGNRGRVIYDATACPQDIAYPTDLDLLSDARGEIRAFDRHAL